MWYASLCRWSCKCRGGRELNTVYLAPRIHHPKGILEEPNKVPRPRAAPPARGFVFLRPPGGAATLAGGVHIVPLWLPWRAPCGVVSQTVKFGPAPAKNGLGGQAPRDRGWFPRQRLKLMPRPARGSDKSCWRIAAPIGAALIVAAARGRNRARAAANCPTVPGSGRSTGGPDQGPHYASGSPHQEVKQHNRNPVMIFPYHRKSGIIEGSRRRRPEVRAAVEGAQAE